MRAVQGAAAAAGRSCCSSMRGRRNPHHASVIVIQNHLLFFPSFRSTIGVSFDFMETDRYGLNTVSCSAHDNIPEGVVVHGQQMIHAMCIQHFHLFFGQCNHCT